MKLGWLAARIVALFIALVAVILALRSCQAPSPHRRAPYRDPRIGILEAKLAEAQIDGVATADTVIRVVTRLRTVRDTLDIHDTVAVKEYVLRVDTLFQQCERCAERMRVLAARADSALAACKSNLPTWRDRLGVWGGYGAFRSDSLVRHGWAVGVGAKLYPW